MACNNPNPCPDCQSCTPSKEKQAIIDGLRKSQGGKGAQEPEAKQTKASELESLALPDRPGKQKSEEESS